MFLLRRLLAPGVLKRNQNNQKPYLVLPKPGFVGPPKRVQGNAKEKVSAKGHGRWLLLEFGHHFPRKNKRAPFVCGVLLDFQGNAALPPIPIPPPPKTKTKNERNHGGIH